MENNKILAAILCAGLLLMITGFIADGLIHPEPLKENAYKVEVEETPSDTGAPAAPKVLPPIGPLLASGSVEAGQAVAKKCAVCHSFEQGGPNRVGPNLWNVVNAKKAHLDNFAYSPALKAVGGNWDYESLNQYLYKPAKFIPGNKMVFAGVGNDQERASLILYLRSLSSNPAALPK